MELGGGGGAMPWLSEWEEGEGRALNKEVTRGFKNGGGCGAGFINTYWEGAFVLLRSGACTVYATFKLPEAVSASRYAYTSKDFFLLKGRF